MATVRGQQTTPAMTMAFLAASYVAQIAVSLAVRAVAEVLFSATTATEAEINDPAGIFRSTSDAMFLYPPFGAPLVNALLLELVRRTLRVRVHSPRAGVALSLLLWLVGPVHGNLLQWTSFKITLASTLYFLAMTFAAAVVNGVILARFARD